MKRLIFPIVYYILLAAATTWLVLDIFVFTDDIGTDPIPVHVNTKTPTPEPTYTEAPTETPEPTDPAAPTSTPTNTPTDTPTPSPTNTPTPTPEGAEVIYQLDDEEIKIKVIKYRNYNTTIYVADIDIAKLDYLKISAPEGKYRNPADWAERYNALIAINGDMYSQASGYVVRNGLVYSTKKATVSDGQVREDLVIYADGSHRFIIEDEESCEDLVADGAWNILSFGPVLIDDGAVVYSKETTKSDKKNLGNNNPRTAIGQTAEGHYVFIVVDGRHSGVDVGVTFDKLAEIGMAAGCVWLYNLDGGQSSQLVFDGKVQNQPYRNGYAERNLSEIVYIGY